ncbi:hypothetical protein GCM10010442_06590 [Kitasatospora kifunensis]
MRRGLVSRFPSTTSSAQVASVPRISRRASTARPLSGIPKRAPPPEVRVTAAVGGTRTSSNAWYACGRRRRLISNDAWRQVRHARSSVPSVLGPSVLGPPQRHSLKLVASDTCFSPVAR